MQKIYEYDRQGYATGAEQEIAAMEGAPPMWTRAVPPSTANGEYALWQAGRWSITNTAPVNTVLAEVPAEVPRWAGLLAIKRHAVIEGDLVLLDPFDEGSTSIFTVVSAFRASMLGGEARDRLDVALDHAKDWTRASPTVVSIAEVAGLSTVHLDELFRWADQQKGTV